jgi:hypothetical protein
MFFQKPLIIFKLRKVLIELNKLLFKNRFGKSAIRKIKKYSMLLKK